MRRQIGPKRHRDERGISTLVSHVLALAIVSILIVGLFVAANGYLQQQREIVTRDGLETVGNRLAAEVSQVARLSNRSANVTVWATHQKKIAGAPYNARVAHGPECDSTLVTSQNCVIVSSVRYDVVRRIPVQNDTAVAINQSEPGRFRITALERPERSKRTTTESTGTLVESNMRFGIGRGVTQDSSGTNVDLLNISPTNLSIRLDPTTTTAYPRSQVALDFIIKAEDIDGKIEKYQVNFDSDRTNDFEVTNTAVSTSELKVTEQYGASYGTYPGYDEPGVYNITLRVTDEDGATRTFRRRINISGLRKVSIQSTPSAIRGYDVELRFENTHSKDIKIRGVYLDPSDDSTNRINADTTAPRNGEWELGFDPDDDGNYENKLQASDNYYDSGEGIRSRILDSGVFSYSGSKNLFPTIDNGTEAGILFSGVRSNGDDDYKIAVTYTYDGKLATATFRTGSLTGSVQPNAEFTVSDQTPITGQTVTFDGTLSTDPGGTIVSYEWDLDGDGTYEETGSSVTKTYSSAGTRTVTLRVTDNDGNTATDQTDVTVSSPGSNKVVLVSGSASEPYTGQVNFKLENTGSTDVTVERFSVSVGGGSNAVELDTSGLSYEQYEVDIDDTGLYDHEPYTLGSPLKSLDQAVVIEDGDTVLTELNGFVSSTGNLADVSGDTIEVTFQFQDGTQKTYTMTP